MSFSKKLDNIWYHYKWTIIMAIGGIILAIILSIGFISNNDYYDFTLTLATFEELSEDDLTTLQNEVKKHCLDTDNDDQISLFLNYHPILDDDEASSDTVSLQSNMAERLAVSSEILSGSNAVFIFDEQSYRSVASEDSDAFANFSVIDSSLDTKKLPLSETTLYNTPLGDDFFICISTKGLSKDRKNVTQTFIESILKKNR